MSRRTIISAVAIAAALAVVLVIAFTTRSGSDGSSPSPSACKAAMKHQFSYGMSHPDAPQGTRPAACQGVSDHDVQKFADQILRDYLNEGS